MKSIIISPVETETGIMLQATFSKVVAKDYRRIIGTIIAYSSHGAYEWIGKNKLQFSMFVETDMLYALESVYPEARIQQALKRYVFLSEDSTKLRRLADMLTNVGLTLHRFENRAVVFYCPDTKNFIEDAINRLDIVFVMQGQLG